HGQIRILQDIVEVRAVLRGQCNADAGVGRNLVTDTVIGRPDCSEDTRREIDDVGLALDGGLYDREFVAAETGDKVVTSRAATQADGDRLQKLIADQVTERVVDALELVNVDIEHRKLLARQKMRKPMLQPVM